MGILQQQCRVGPVRSQNPIFQAFCDGKVVEILHSSRAISFPSSGKTTMTDVPSSDDVKHGDLAGLPVDLKLVDRDQARSPQILLTEAGWSFAVMRNPILDEGKDGRQSRFSNEEIEFLISHIRNQVPIEALAYKLVLEAIAQGANTPDKLDHVLEEYLPKREHRPFTRAFLTTQRAGVISRMIDLNLVKRIRDGIKVTYIAATSSFESSPNLLQRAI